MYLHMIHNHVYMEQNKLKTSFTEGLQIVKNMTYLLVKKLMENTAHSIFFDSCGYLHKQSVCSCQG